MHSLGKMKPLVSSHKKGTAPEKTTSKLLSDLTRKRPFLKKTNCVISEERDRSKPNRLLCHFTRKGPLLQKTNKDPNQNCRNRSQNASGSLEPCHSMWRGLRLEILIAGGSVSHQAWSSSTLKGHSNIFLIALETRSVLYNGSCSKTSQVVFFRVLSLITRGRR